jgi:hypothetical protein
LLQASRVQSAGPEPLPARDRSTARRSSGLQAGSSPRGPARSRPAKPPCRSRRVPRCPRAPVTHTQHRTTIQISRLHPLLHGALSNTSRCSRADGDGSVGFGSLSATLLVYDRVGANRCWITDGRCLVRRTRAALPNIRPRAAACTPGPALDTPHI